MSIDDRLPADVRLHQLCWDPAQAEAWRVLLPEEERARLDGYGVEKRQREFLLGRVAARQLLADVLGCAPVAVPLVVAEGGAVEVQAGGALRLSISHAGGEAVAATARRPVGVDLEATDPDLERPDRMRRFLLADEERALCDALPLPPGAAFALCWALKEAVLKALQCGLRRSPKTVRLAEVDVEAGHAWLDAQGRSFAAPFAHSGEGRWLTVAYERNDES